MYKPALKRGFSALLLLIFMLTFLVPSLGTPKPVSAAFTPAIAISSSSTFSLALRSDGTVWSWGENSEGQLGDGTNVSENIPVEVMGLKNVKAISTGDQHSLALKEDGTVWAWGDNERGALGNGTTLSQSTPTQVKGLSDIVAIAGGWSSNLAVKRDGTVWAWGTGLLGDGTDVAIRTTPAQVPGLTKAVSAVLGFGMYYVLNSDGTVWAWGWNNFGQLGDGTKIERWTPVQVKGLTEVKAISADRYALALKKDGTVWQWGKSQNNAGYHIENLIPEVVPDFAGVTAIAVNSDANLAIKGDGTVWTWGRDVLTGEGGSANTLSPIQVKGLNGIIAITSYLYLKNDGTIWAMGTDASSGAGSYDEKKNSYPVQNLLDKSPLPPMVTKVSFEGGSLNKQPLTIDVTMNQFMDSSTFSTQTINLKDESGNPVGFEITERNPKSVSIRTDKLLPIGSRYTLYVDGMKNYRGMTMTSPYIYPFSIVNKTPAYSSEISAGGFHSLDILFGEVYAWGDNSFGQLGDGTATMRLTPVKVNGLANVVFISAGGFHNLALLKDGTVKAWGDNEYGQLGDGSTVKRLTPVTVQGLTDIVALAAGEYQSLALKSDGTVWAWGNNSYGQIGIDTTIVQTTPIQVEGLNEVIYIASGGSHCLAVTQDGKVWAWGNNYRGQLGNGSTENRTQPVQVKGVESIKTVAAGRSHSLALQEDGTVWSWGDNTYGNLGNGSQEPYSTVPVQVLSKALRIDAGYDFNLAALYEGIYAWGANQFDQLGDYSSETFQNKPVLSNPLLASRLFSAGGYHSLSGGDNSDVLAWGFNGLGQIGNGLTQHESAPVQSLVNEPTVYYRAAGNDAPETASVIAESGWSYGSEAVVLVNENGYADALTGTPLASALDAPILLTNNKVLPSTTKASLDYLQPSTIFILGGTAVVSEEIERNLRQNYSVVRIGGYDQYETASLIAHFLYQNNLCARGKAVLAYGENFPDALAVSSLAAFQRIPILLTRTHQLPQIISSVIEELRVKDTFVVGGSAVISDQVANSLPGMKRYSGIDKYQTALEIAKGMGADLNAVFIATGDNFPDALAGSVLASRTNSPILLVGKDTPDNVYYYLNNYAEQIDEVIVLGGTAVVSDAVLGRIQEMTGE